jgi:EpsI family protein
MLARALTVAVLIVAAGTCAQVAAKREVVAPRLPLDELPLRMGEWQGQNSRPFADDVVASLGVDDYINRWYERESTPVAAYIGYYGSQRRGDTIHSPQNCLPGGGWVPLESGYITIPTERGPVVVNRYEIAKGLNRQMVLYWYQGRGRVVANEYANKAWLMFDVARSGRSSGGLVRLITPVRATPEAATSELSSFAALLLSHLDEYLP